MAKILQQKRSATIYASKELAVAAMTAQLPNLKDGQLIIGSYYTGTTLSSDASKDVLGMAIKKTVGAVEISKLHVLSENEGKGITSIYDNNLSADTFTYISEDGLLSGDVRMFYDSALYDSKTGADQVMPNAVGGIAAGTSASTLSKLSLSEVYDKLLFPVIAATKVTSLGVTLPADQTLEVGTAFPTITATGVQETWKTNTKTYHRSGAFSLATFYTGTTYAAASAGQTAMPTTVPTGNTVIYSYGTYAAGENVYKSDGTTLQLSALEAGTVDKSDTMTVTGVYYYGTNMTGTVTTGLTDIVKASGVLKTGTGTTITATSSEIVNTQNQVVTNGGYQIAIPPTITATTFTVMQYNAGSGKYDANDSANWEISTDTITLNDAASTAYTCRILQHKTGQAGNNPSSSNTVSFIISY